MKKAIYRVAYLLIVCVVAVAVTTLLGNQQKEKMEIERTLECVVKDPYTYKVSTGYFHIGTSGKKLNIQYNDVTGVCSIQNEEGYELILQAKCYKCGWRNEEVLDGNVTRTCKCGQVHFTIETN